MSEVFNLFYTPEHILQSFIQTTFSSIFHQSMHNVMQYSVTGHDTITLPTVYHGHVARHAN